MAADENVPVTLTERDGKPLLKLRGTVDILAVQDLAHAARGLVERSEDTLLCCEQVQYLDAAALQLLLALSKALRVNGKKLEIIAKSPQVERLFEWAALSS
jgi:anti-anti-sigma factor